MASVTLGAHVTARDNLGRFVARWNAAVQSALEETVKEGQAVARDLAPVKTGDLRKSIQGVMLGDKSAGLTVGTDHWKYQEDGTRPHQISGFVRFYWNARKREWESGPNMIKHPGNPARHFIAAAKEDMRGKLAQRIRENMG
jgi:HK97 gp10 family phage protein